MFGSDTSLYTLVFVGSSFGLVSQRYSDGGMNWFRRLNETVNAECGMVQDSTTKAIYITTSRYDISTYGTQGVFKIDPTTTPPS